MWQTWVQALGTDRSAPACTEHIIWCACHMSKLNIEGFGPTEKYKEHHI